MKIEGLTAIVTGGASGLGEACVNALAASGAKVFVADVDEQAGRKFTTKDNITFIPTDVTDADQVEALFENIESDGEPARILINCAGMAPRLPLVRAGVPHSIEAFEHIFKVNVTGTFLPISRFATRLQNIDPIGEETGVIVNTSSITAFDGQVGQIAYAATKGAVASMTLPLARELAQDRIRAVAIAPGPFQTSMMKNIPDGSKVKLGTQIPHPKRLGAPDEFAQLVCHIIANPMLNGEVIRLDGALRMTAQ